AKAKTEHPDLDWVQADGKTWAPDAPAQVIYSNAALHWIDDHAGLFSRRYWGSAQRLGGRLRAASGDRRN
ncbi:MAG: hypothetical protein MI861_25495, partial [Pirellulales bacterium]|nr:hypothetical protein [Pirellulales bacterium]